jgi:hypothetical protein
MASSADDKLTARQQQWLDRLRRLAEARRTSSWELGDLLLTGEKWEGSYQLAMEATGLKYGSLRNLAWMAKTFPPEARVKGASWRLHRAVAVAVKAGLAFDRASAWLERAVEFGWSPEVLRREMHLDGDLRAEQPPGWWEKPSVKDTDYRCPHCGYEWNGHPRPPRQADDAQVRKAA